MKSIAILFGGPSAEHEVSIKSAINVIQNLDQRKYGAIYPIFIDRNKIWYMANIDELINNASVIKINDSPVFMINDGSAKLIVGQDRYNIDIVFPVLHGPFGEDGVIQGFLTALNVPFVGSGIIGSALGMDKYFMKQIFIANNIPTAKFLCSYKKAPLTIEQIESEFNFPVFIKPANMGSSVGVSKVYSYENLEKAFETAFRYDNKVIVEEFVEARELECAVLNGNDVIASSVGEIVPKHDFYSYEAKYLDPSGAQLIIPAQIDDVSNEKIKDLAIRVFKILDCRGLARVDFFMKKNGDILVNEINTMPGFTNISMYPKLFEHAGITYRNLIEILIEISESDFKNNSELLKEYER